MDLKRIRDGERKNLREAKLWGADLRDANLQRAKLWDADLRDADLQRADLRDANLQRADLQRADLQDANLQRADLRGANLRGAGLRRADLHGTNLRAADLRWADLRDANLRGANLQRTNLRNAQLRGADLRGAELPHFKRLPEDGEFIAYKGCRGAIVKLRVPEGADRASSLVGPKCRVEYAEVVEVLDAGGNESSVTEARSNHDKDFVYVEGEVVYPDGWDDDIRTECTHGIHVFPSKDEAKDWVR